MSRKFGCMRRTRAGATLVLIALLLAFLIGMVAFTVEVGRMYLVRAQMQTAVDAGALAGTLALREDPTAVKEAAVAARDFVQKNRVGWLVTVPKDAIDVQIGQWNNDTQTFVETGASPNAIRVYARQDKEPLFFARVMGQKEFGVPQAAIAAADSEPLDVMLVLDLSGSMKDEGRIQALQNAAPTFVDAVEKLGTEHRIGVMGYGANPLKYNPILLGHSGTLYQIAPILLYPNNSNWVGVLEAGLTDDFSSLKSGALAKKSLTASRYIDGYTPTGAAIRDAAHYLNANAREDVKKVIVLMSDGYANRPENGPDDYAVDMANYASSMDITLYTISLGNGADKKLMTKIAQKGGGEHFDATGSGESQLTKKLNAAFNGVVLAIGHTQLVQ